MAREVGELMYILNAKGANGGGNNIYVKDYKDISIQFATDGGGDAALTVKFQGSTQDDSPDFGAAQSVTNHWDYIEVIDIQSGSAIDGDTGIAVATADNYLNLEYNENGLIWINAIVSGRTEGEVTVKARGFNK